MTIDPQAIKDRQRQDWDVAAPTWCENDERLRRAYEATTRRLLELAGIAPGHRVLDIASGTGEPGLPAAEIAGPSGFVLLTDQSPGCWQSLGTRPVHKGFRTSSSASPMPNSSN